MGNKEIDTVLINDAPDALLVIKAEGSNEIFRVDKEGIIYNETRIKDAGEAYRIFMRVLNAMASSLESGENKKQTYCEFMATWEKYMKEHADYSICSNCGGTGINAIICCNGQDCMCMGKPVDYQFYCEECGRKYE